MTENAWTDSLSDESGLPWYVTGTRRLLTRLRPYLGWFTLLICAGLAAFPPLGLDALDWLDLRRIGSGLAWVGGLGVVAAWLILGWRRPWLDARRGRWWLNLLQALAALLLLTMTGLLVLSQLLGHWLPGFGDLWRAARTQAWSALGGEMLAAFARLADHYALWWRGVQAGGAAQDNLVFAGFAGLLFWWTGALTAWLARRFRKGLLAALPPLWLLSLMLLYAGQGRLLLVAALAVALLLHLVLDQAELFRRWRERGIDFAPSLMVDRLLAVVGIIALLLTLAAITPNLRVDAIAWRYYQFIEPANKRAEAYVKRLFPDLRAGGGIFGRTIAGGLPNQFLITSANDLGKAEVMRVRTNEPPASYDQPPPGHYMRGGTFSVYDGRGWGNPADMTYDAYSANEPWTDLPWEGRKPLVQQIFLAFNSPVIYAAGEPLEPTKAYRAEVRAPEDLSTLRARVRSYAILSRIPAVDDATLAAAPGWSQDRPLPDGYEQHLTLPETVTPRTRALAAELTAGLETPFAKAQAIERYLRTIEYDLNVPLPPDDVTDVADYFLFDLQRGYCDYYATAFVVLARSVGLPTRFATGFAVGQWDVQEQIYVVTEAEAHSWPEVYFPDYGWIPFEPTGGRPPLDRRAASGASASQGVDGMQTEEEALAAFESLSRPVIDWNWQMLFWLLPLGLLIWGGVWLARRWRQRREDPWLALVGWGTRQGRPMGDEETALEYGRGLGQHIETHVRQPSDSSRTAAHEVVALSDDVTQARYGPASARASALEQAATRWARLRGYLRRLRLGELKIED